MKIQWILALAAFSIPATMSANLLATVGNLLGSTVNLLGTTVGQVGGLLGEVVDTVDTILADVTEGTAAITLTTLASQCSLVKKLLLLHYDQMEKTGNEPDLSKLTLNFITKSSYESYNLSTAAEEIPKSCWFNPEHELVIFVHGFTDGANKTTFKGVKEAFFSRGQYNIVALDASALIGWLYLRSSTYVNFIGQALGLVLSAFYDAGMPTSSMYLVGHSLGAHICGFDGKTFTSLKGVKASRITGLDPAGPCFADVEDSLKLKSSDAEFVDVMHTNAGVFGLNENIGHVDYWPNGGTVQPHCTLQIACAHSRTHKLFADSVRSPDNFKAVACDSWLGFKAGKCSSDTSLMGFGCSNTTRGVYYLQTAKSSPYGLGDDGTKYTS